jgi:uncharacterized protein (TIGR03435 family)
MVVSASAGAAAFVQTPNGEPKFEATSIRVAVEGQGQSGGRVTNSQGGEGSQDPTLFRYTNVVLRDLLTNAYGVKSYQIFGPDLLTSQRYDVNARVPVGATKVHVRQMLQNLLAERFGTKAAPRDQGSPGL